MYAMMLPSGNDAAQSLAIYFGNLCLLRERKGSGLKGRRGDAVDANIDESDYPEDEEPTSDLEQEKSPAPKNEAENSRVENMS